MTDSNTPPQSGTPQVQLDHDRAEEIIDVLKQDIDDLRDEIPAAFKDDVDDIEDRVDTLDNAVDDHQDEEGENPLGPVPAELDYLQQTVENLGEQTDAESATNVSQGLEAVEEEFEVGPIKRSAWFALVDGIPEVYDERVVKARQLKEQGDVEGDTEQYTVRAVPSAGAELADSIASFPEDDQDVDLDEYQFFLTEKTEGGVV